ncbi:ESCRT-II subunit protein SNF8 [Ascoidea rubescens DSM 1968]|uniref:Winged helix DNA-binding domain-containing protein n=1 Tax=Ascoidea rubescens DSM 1968 TaxID=1344418 RepID=A0A1D2VFI4_9ASCO|nr:winged helix DNA-binding domain-containing protein [Ascoidea rubescens DSM 1968]ODV60438.1 winged helix DNA-binding domain-containing protein [Ascoidea rubescens DSM 1968]
MNRKLGLASFQNNEDEFSKISSQLIQQQSNLLSDQLKLFQENLINFAKKYNNEIKNNPDFSRNFYKLCLSIGVDPLAASISVKTTTTTNTNTHQKKNLWSNLILNDNDEEFYNELSVKIIEICRQTSNLNGGLISIKNLLNYLNDPSNPNKIENLVENDIIISINKIKILNPNFKIINNGNENLISSLSIELNSDQNQILVICKIIKFVTVRILMDNFKWSRLRSQQVLNSMVEKGFLWIDTQDDNDQTAYWDPSWI